MTQKLKAKGPLVRYMQAFRAAWIIDIGLGKHIPDTEVEVTDQQIANELRNAFDQVIVDLGLACQAGRQHGCKQGQGNAAHNG